MSPASIGRVAALAACLGLALAPRRARAEDRAQAPQELSASGGQSPETVAEVKKLFAAQCGWCHADYGLKAGKAPQLAGTRMTEKQVASRIRNGKEDAMPAFRKTLTEDQIQAFAGYIKGLPGLE